MEHRWSKRVPLQVRVQLYHQEIPVALGATRNINRDGVYVDVPGSEFVKGTSLDVEFLAAQAELAHRRLRAVVVHSSSEGLGLMFGNIDSVMLDELYQQNAESPT